MTDTFFYFVGNEVRTLCLPTKDQRVSYERGEDGERRRFFLSTPPHPEKPFKFQIFNDSELRSGKDYYLPNGEIIKIPQRSLSLQRVGLGPNLKHFFIHHDGAQQQVFTKKEYAAKETYYYVDGSVAITTFVSSDLLFHSEDDTVHFLSSPDSPLEKKQVYDKFDLRREITYLFEDGKLAIKTLYANVCLQHEDPNRNPQDFLLMDDGSRVRVFSEAAFARMQAKKRSCPGPAVDPDIEVPLEKKAKYSESTESKTASLADFWGSLLNAERDSMDNVDNADSEDDYSLTI